MPVKAASTAGLVIALLLSLALPGAAGAAVSAPAASGPTQPVDDFAGAVRETVWVDTGIDGDGDGKSDRVAADIVRPTEPTAAGQKIPVIMDASPYYSCCGRGNESEVKTYDSSGRPVGFPLFYDNYFVPRGYAVVLVDLAGTNRSKGCADVGGPSDVGSAKAVIDWLNGRAQGFTAVSGGTAVTPSWTNGSVGMIGKSYDGTIADGVAATGVAGLKTIVPISAISAWYDYYNADGVSFGEGGPSDLAQTVEQGNGGQNCSAENQKLVQGAPANGDVSAAWNARNYVANVANVHASVFASQGLEDLNVKTIQFGQWWAGLAANNVERKVWLSQTGHVDPFDYRRADWVDALHQWFDHYLMGIDNGVQNGPQASIERHPDQWVDQSSWPAEGSTVVAMKPHAGTTAGVGTLTTAASSGTASFTDNPKQDETAWAAQPTSASSARTLFTTGPLQQDLHISGTGSVTVTATPSTSSAHLSAVLVDYGSATIRNATAAGEGIKTGTTQSCWGENAPGDDGCYLDTSADTANVGLEIFSRGWADLANYQSLSQETPLTPGKPVTMTFRLASTDHIVPKGHQLALIIAGTDRGFSAAPSSPGKITLDLSQTSAGLPIAGPAPTFTAATFTPPIAGAGQLRALPDTRLDAGLG
jgi:X-Pro dipeptidyl-peptidase